MVLDVKRWYSTYNYRFYIINLIIYKSFSRHSTHSSLNPTFCPEWEFSVNVGIIEGGVGGQYVWTSYWSYDSSRKGRLNADCINKMGPQQERGLQFKKWTTIFHDRTPIDHRNNIRFFKTQVEPLAAGEFFTAKFYENFDVSLLSRIDHGKLSSICLFVCLFVFFSITLTVSTSISIEVSR